MHKHQELLSTLGQLVRSTRSLQMDQKELGLRVGIGRNTVSAIENGKSVNSESLALVLAHLNIADDIQELIDTKLKESERNLVRKSRLPHQELDNDF